MQRLTSTVAAAVLVSLCVAGCASSGARPAANSTAGACCCTVPPGQSTAVDAKTAEALRMALQDERRAQAFYSSVMAKHGQVRPFANIVHAEERHEAMVAELMDRHGVATPPADLSSLPPVPQTLKECNQLAATLERENIALYDRLLKDVTEPDIRTAFERMRAMSLNNHLPAFERWSTAPAAAS